LLSVVKIKVKKRNNMENGIGPQNLGAAGMSTKSKPCGSPLDASASQNAAFGPGSKLAKKDPERAAAILDGINEADSPENYGTPLDFQDDVTKIQEAAGVLEAHNVGSGDEVQGASAAAQENAAAQIGQARTLAGNRGAMGSTGGIAGGPLAGRIADMIKRRRLA
jgi:hypothetical protein